MTVLVQSEQNAALLQVQAECAQKALDRADAFIDDPLPRSTQFATFDLLP
jgi:hypothetical protein